MRAYGFVDWSGDAGFKFALGSSTHFVISLISSVDEMKLRHELAQLRAQRSLPRAFEFHFAHNPNSIRAAFFTALPDLACEGAVLVIDKRELGDEVDRASESSLYGFVLGHLLARAPLDIIDVKRLLIDEREKVSAVTQGMRTAASPVFSARGLKRTPKFRGEPAHQFDGLQVADMLAGAVMNKERGGQDYLRGSRSRVTLYHYK